MKQEIKGHRLRMLPVAKWPMITFGSPAVCLFRRPVALRPPVAGGLPLSCDRCLLLGETFRSPVCFHVTVNC